jgi:uncharacterized membrane protein
MSSNPFGPGGSGALGPRRPSLLAIIGLLLAVASVFFPAVGAIVISAVAIVLGVFARRQLKRDPSTGPSWISLTALIVGGFVFLSQAVLLTLFYFSG